MTEVKVYGPFIRNNIGRLIVSRKVSYIAITKETNVANLISFYIQIRIM